MKILFDIPLSEVIVDFNDLIKICYPRVRAH